MAKRLFDITVSLILLTFLLIPMIFIAILVKSTSPGPVLFWSPRVGRNNKVFQMPKFRTMHTNAPLEATHLIKDPQFLITPIGRFLRKTSADEFPQLYSIIIGDMSLVGPRPALYNQDDLIALRVDKGIHRLRPGLTGLAQIMGRDEIDITEKVALDQQYLINQSFITDILIIFKTVLYIFFQKNISH